MFKESGSRFSILSEQNASSSPNKSFATTNKDNFANKERRVSDNYNRSSNIFHSKDDTKNKKLEFSFSEEMFPSLSNNIVEVNGDINETHFLDKLLSKNEHNEDKEWVLPDGWVEITAKNREISYSYGKNMKIEKEVCLFDVCKELAYKYEKWENDYIDTWGNDEYEKMYKFPNYDYGYFDRLDEKAMDESETEDENDEEYIDAYDDYSDYY